MARASACACQQPCQTSTGLLFGHSYTRFTFACRGQSVVASGVASRWPSSTIKTDPLNQAVHLSIAEAVHASCMRNRNRAVTWCGTRGSLRVPDGCAPPPKACCISYVRSVSRGEPTQKHIRVETRAILEFGSYSKLAAVSRSGDGELKAD